MMKLKFVLVDDGVETTYGEMEIETVTTPKSRKGCDDFKVKMSRLGAFTDTSAKLVEANMNDFDQSRFPIEWQPWLLVFGALQGIISNAFPPSKIVKPGRH